MGELRPLVLILAAKWWPLSARMAAALRDHGCRVAALCPHGHPLFHVSGLSKLYAYRGVFSLRALRRALEDCTPDAIVPCDDGVVAQLHELHRTVPSLRALIETSLGSPENFPIVASRYEFLNAASALGIRVPETRRIFGPQDLISWHEKFPTDAVIKIDGESGGNGVRISNSLPQSLEALQDLRRRPSYATAWKRLIIDRDPLCLWQCGDDRARGLTVQEFIPGRPANAMFVCWRGKLLASISVVVVAAEGPTGAAVIVRVIINQEILSAAERLASRLKLSGFYGLDFVIDVENRPYLIEMNPRCTQLGHMELAEQGSLAGVFSAALRRVPSGIAENPINRPTIGLFPQALAAGERCKPYLDASYHDIPTNEPELVKELMLRSWPQRRWASRLYHSFSPLRPSEAAVFEEVNPVELQHKADLADAPVSKRYGLR